MTFTLKERKKIVSKKKMSQALSPFLVLKLTLNNPLKKDTIAL